MASFSLLINPESDEEFGHHVRAAARTGVESPDELQAKLRATYPHGKVNAGVTEPDGRQRWYVYRDGRWAG